METLMDVEALKRLVLDIQTWLLNEVLVLGTLIQLGVVIGAYLVARVGARSLRIVLLYVVQRSKGAEASPPVERLISTMSLPILWLAVQWLAVGAAIEAGLPNQVIQITVSLLTAWVVIRLASQLVRDPTWSRMVAITAWTLAALNIVGLLDDASALLDDFALTLGGLRISALTVIKGVMALAVLLWSATVLSELFESRIGRLPNVTPAARVLFAKLLKIVLVTIAVVAALRTVGIDLTAFAVFSGAVGVGVGFGLQKVVSNLISGVILLLDRSVKPGDVIEVGDTYGWINTLGARYASVVTRDGTEFLIPNEDIITQQVVNWSYSNDRVRLKVPLGISYHSDPRKAIALCLEAARETTRVLANPVPICLLMGFGDSSVDLEIRFWINDPQNGVSNVKSEILLRVWDKFHAEGIEIPFPQRDVHVRASDPLPVRLDSDAAAPSS